MKQNKPNKITSKPHPTTKRITTTKLVVDNKNVQFSIDYGVKHRVDVLKAKHKEDIIAKYKLSRRHISNTDAIRYLLDKVGA